MIQFNLLPQSSLENVKARRSERVVLLVAVIAALVSIVILILSLGTVGLQKHSLSAANADIAKYQTQISQIPNVNDILTLQNQLRTLATLTSSDPVATRLFTYLPQITPNQASIGLLSINFDLHTISITGSANSLQAVNEFADTLKFTVYQVAGSTTNHTAFTSVVLANFGRDPAGASFDLELKYDPALFSAAQNVTLSVPQNYITTRSFTQLQNSTLFDGASSSPSQKASQ